ncbi:hypothetical protein NLG97_g9097 [Lecanicillium saksenae]|uniref:Uncharacterized protein n=1 Tax=Lecanicillium saksenae TaxID=468837 RepID=A0ACC1QJF8_9HYPO|nr:hypothetical protein NLG97_g9097 [Lecanicillium saksenae]
MAEIYRRSNKVVVWLGEEADDSSYAMSCINGIDCRLASRSSKLKEDRRAAARKFDNRAFRATYQLLLRPWWSRSWIIQEATCGNETDLRCGSDVTNFVAVVAVINCMLQVLLPSLQNDSSLDIRHLQRVVALDQLKIERARPQYRSNMMGLLDQFRTGAASDPRDKIFALSALATGAEETAANPDYSISVDKAYAKFAYNLIMYGGNLDILGHCQVAVRTIHSWSQFKLLTTDLIPERTLPSWIPDWTELQETTPFPKCEWPDDVGSQKLYKSTGQFLPSAKLAKGFDTLFIRGFTFDRIRSTSPDASPVSPTISIQSWKTWVETELGSTSMRCGTLLDVFSHTITADISAVGGRWMRGSKAKVLGTTASGIIPEWSDEMSVIRMTVHSRRLFYSEKGYLGLARYDAKVGDKICLLHGGSVPYILRQDDESCHLFKGECYVHGLMDGEGMRFPHVWEDFALH